jgi:tetratricopeptide (TPR) repeat protein
LAVAPPIVDASGARERERDPEPVTAGPRIAAARSGVPFVLASLGAVVVAVIGSAYAVRHPELALPAALELRANLPKPPQPARIAAAQHALVELLRPSAGEVAPAPPPTAASPDSADDESARHTQPIESESDDMPMLANVAPKPRVAARNPWRSAIPKELRPLRSAIQAGARGSDHTIATLRRYNREHPTDSRGHLLLASLYLNREWRADAINQYGVAYQIDPSARGAPELLANVLGCVARGSAVSEAQRLIEHVYKREALPALERLIRNNQKDARAVARLGVLKARLLARDP